MSHSTNVIQHSVLGDGTVGLHPVKGIAAAAQYSPLCASDLQVVDWSHQNKYCMWVYDPRVNPLHTPFWVPSTGPVYKDVWAWQAAGPGPYAGANMQFVLNDGFLADNPSTAAVKFNTGQSTLPGTDPNYYLRYQWFTVYGQDATKRNIDFAWSTPTSATIFTASTSEDNSFQTWGGNWDSASDWHINAQNDGEYYQPWCQNNGYGYYMVSFGVIIISMENNF